MLDPRRGFCGINRIKDLGLRGIERHGISNAVGPMVQPRGAVMPDECLVDSERSVCRIDALPSLRTVIADAHTIYHARRGMILL